jgi:hypothetical protein
MEFFICNVVLFCASCFALSACHFLCVFCPRTGFSRFLVNPVGRVC